MGRKIEKERLHIYSLELRQETSRTEVFDNSIKYMHKIRMSSDTWIARIRDDVPTTNIVKVAQAKGVLITGMNLRELRHLQCQAPVFAQTVLTMRDALTTVFVANIQSGDMPGYTYFEVFPKDSTSLSKLDHDVSKALHLSNPVELRAAHMGPLYELQFYEGDQIIEKKRWELFSIGIELGPYPSMLTHQRFFAKRTTPIVQTGE